jgi:CubicO group peptidase (beta-lactamase class C family)
MDERIFDGLGMTRTTMDIAAFRAEANRAVGRQRGFPEVPVHVPMTAAGGAYTDAHDLGIFLRFMLDEGKHGPSSLPGPAEFTQMLTTPNHGGYGLGVAVGRRGDDLFLNHGGGGYGFLSWMAWYPTLGIGIAVLTNSGDLGDAPVALAMRVVDRLVERGIAAPSFRLTYLPVCGISLPVDPVVEPYFTEHREAAAWKEEWARYIGTYELSTYAKPAWYARLAIRLGVVKAIRVRVARKGGAMLLDGAPLYEARPGLFFTESGEALDFRGDPPTWRNITIRRR